MIYSHIKCTDKSKNKIERKYSNKEFVTAKLLTLTCCMEKHKAPYNENYKHHNGEKSQKSEKGRGYRYGKFIISHKCQLIYSAAEGTVSHREAYNVCQKP